MIHAVMVTITIFGCDFVAGSYIGKALLNFFLKKDNPEQPSASFERTVHALFKRVEM